MSINVVLFKKAFVNKFYNFVKKFSLKSKLVGQPMWPPKENIFFWLRQWLSSANTVSVYIY